MADLRGALPTYDSSFWLKLRMPTICLGPRRPAREMAEIAGLVLTVYLWRSGYKKSFLLLSPIYTRLRGPT